MSRAIRATALSLLPLVVACNAGTIVGDDACEAAFASLEACMEGELTAGGRRCRRASGIWKFLASRAPAAPGERGAGPESSA